MDSQNGTDLLLYLFQIDIIQSKCIINKHLSSEEDPVNACRCKDCRIKKFHPFLTIMLSGDAPYFSSSLKPSDQMHHLRPFPLVLHLRQDVSCQHLCWIPIRQDLLWPHPLRLVAPVWKGLWCFSSLLLKSRCNIQTDMSGCNCFLYAHVLSSQLFLTIPILFSFISIYPPYALLSFPAKGTFHQISIHFTV